MSGIKEQAELESMRKRLYERSGSLPPSDRVQLQAEPRVVPTAWTTPVPVPSPLPQDPREGSVVSETLTLHTEKRRRPYRLIALAAAALTLIFVLAGTGLYLFLGNNQVSNKNITVTLTGPLSVGGGEALPLETTIENKNNVAIESGVLIMNFPSGTKTADEQSRDILEERISLNRIEPGETVKVPFSAVVFGEENQGREIKATLEYRLVESSGTFYKEAAPLAFTIISAPVVIQVNALKKVSSGQEIEVTLTVQSNASAPLKDVLVTADYPNSFDFTSAEPAAAYRESAWIIKELLPEQATTIKLRGKIIGQQSEEFQMKFSAGTAKTENQFMIGSVLANASTDFEIEQPFINVGIAINGTESEVVTLKTGEQTNVTVNVQNTLADSLYDMVVEVALKGNILVKDAVSVTGGFYDSTKDVIRFEPSGDSRLEQVEPGGRRSFNFSIDPSSQKETPSFTVTANTYARRVSESRATEQLVGTAAAEAKFTASVALVSELGRGNGGFTETGPVPPVADVATTYTVFLQAEAGGNDVTGATLTTALPQYVNWQNQTTGDGKIIFNPISKEISWTIGDIEAGSKKQIAFQVSLLPSQTQVGSVPAVLTTQRFRATDRFTGAVVRADGIPLNTTLSTEAGFGEGSGIVQPTGSVTTGE